MRQPQKLGHDHTRLPVSQIVGLKPGQDQVRLPGGGLRQQFGDAQRIEGGQVVFLDMNRAVGALGQRLADGLRDPRRPGAQGDHFAAMLLLQPQRLFQRESIRLIGLETEVVFLNPAAAGIDTKQRIARGDLLYGDQIFMGRIRLYRFENQATVGAAETERVRERVIDLHGPRLMRNIVQIALRREHLG